MGLFAQIEKEFMEGPEPSNIGERLGLDEDQVIGKSARFWGWSIEAAAPDGVVRGAGAVRAIERAAGWTGPRGKLVDAFIAAGILAKAPDGIRVCGWVDRYGNIHDEARSERARRAALIRWGKDAPDAQSNASSMRPASPEQSPANAPAMPDPDPDPDLDPNQDSKPPPTPSAVDPAGKAVVVEVEEPYVDADSSGISRQRTRTRLKWERDEHSAWEFIQRVRELNGLKREEPLTGKAWTKFTTWFARALEAGGQEAITDIVHAFVGDQSIRTPNWPTSVLLKAWDVRLEAWRAER